MLQMVSGEGVPCGGGGGGGGGGGEGGRGGLLPTVVPASEV